MDPAQLITKSIEHLKKNELQQAVALVNQLVPLSDKPQSHQSIMSQIEPFVTHVLCRCDTKTQLPLIVRCVVILMNVSKNEALAPKIGHLAIHHIVSQLIVKQVEPQTVEYSVMLLRNLMRRDENRLLFSSNEQLLGDLIRSFMIYESKNRTCDLSVASHRNTTINLLGCMGLMASNELVAELLVSTLPTNDGDGDGSGEGLLNRLIDMLKFYGARASFSNDLEMLMVSTLQCLQYLAYYCDDNALKMHRLGLEKVLIAHYVTRGGNVGKVSSTLNVILSQNEAIEQEEEADDGGETDAKDGENDENAIITTLIAQLRNDEDEDAQVRAISNLWSLASRSSNRQLLRERNVAQELLRILQTSSYVENIQEAVGCLATLSQDAITATWLARQNGVAIMARLLSVKDEYQIQLYAISIFGFMCILTDEALDDVRRYQLVDRLKQALKSSLATLRELSSVEKRNKKLNEDMETMNDIITYLVRIFAAMSREDDLCEEMEDAGLLDLLMDLILEDYTSEADMYEQQQQEVLEDSAESVLAAAKKQREQQERKGIKVAACTALWNMVNNERMKSKIYAREGAVEVMTMMLADIDLSNSNSLLAKRNAGLSDSELAQLTNTANKSFDVDMSNLEALQRRLAVQSGLASMADDGELELEELELEPEELDPEELEPEELEPEALEPEELEPEEIEPEELEPEEIEPEELEPEEEEDPEVLRQQMLREEEERRLKEEKIRRRLLLEKKREEREKRREERRLKKRQERAELKKLEAERAEKDTEAKKKRAAKRLMIVKELQKTEENYVNALEKMKKEFMEPLLTTKRGILPQDKIKTIFSDVGIIHMINRDFLRELNLLFVDMEDLEKNMEGKIGDLFLRRAATFKLYSNYVNNYDLAEMTMHECLRKFKPFAQFLEEVSDKLLEEGLRQTDLASHLILPIQRLPRYSLLLADLIKHSDADPSSSGYAFIQNALLEINRITNVVNENKRIEEFREKANELGKRLGLKTLERSKSSTWKRTEEKLPLYTYEKFRPTATRSKKLECTLHLLSDLVIIQRTDSLVKKAVYEIPLHELKCDKKVADKDREGLCATLEDIRDNGTAEEPKVVFEVVFPNRTLRDDIVQQIRNTQLNYRAGIAN